MVTPSDSQKIWDAVRESNQAWLSGRPEEVSRLFHEDAVAVFTDAGRRLAGRDAIVRSYVEYCQGERTLAFNELDHEVDMFGDTAVVSYRFLVRYEAEGKVHDECGQEILVFMRRQGRWGVVWRTQVALNK
jgi:uncharacterized protein (TIGR02246 family)